MAIQGETRTQRTVRTAWLPGPGLWVWEVVEPASGETIESSWTLRSAGYATGEEAQRAGFARLRELARGASSPAAADPASADVNDRRPLLIIVPRARSELYHSLRQSFDHDDGKVQVILDRRFRERRARRGDPEGGRRRGDRRLRADIDADLKAGRWVAVRALSTPIDFRDPDARAILFLCCSDHVLACARCGDTYGIRWLIRGSGGVHFCPRCRSNVTQGIVAHARSCGYWTGRMHARGSWPGVRHVEETATG